MTLLQQAFFCTLWLLAARLRLARRPALHWAAATGVVGVSMGLLLLRDIAGPWLAVVVVNLCFVASFILLRRGVQDFARLAHADREQVIVMLLGVVLLAAAMAWGRSKLPVIVGVSLLVAWTLFRSAGEVRGPLVTEFGRGVALWLGLPISAIGVLFVLRAVIASVVGGAAHAPIDEPVPVNVGMMFVSMVLGVMINATLMAMVIGRMVLRLQYQSEHDSLTGLLSRRPMEKLLQAEALRQRRSGQPYALLSVDIDHFKQINDRCGHAAGDAVLVCVAQALQKVAREVDSVARMGGEEFFALLPGTDLAGAQQAAQRMLDAVRRLECPQAGESIVVSISIGVAVASAGSESVQAMLRRVDHALYAAKAAGRDRIEVAPPPAPAPA
ncbi:MAG: GGDEF domain-containing protein [Rubrivivax sp.]|nr:GGDEF domain-containing protein [Rubrivivax sp.]